MNWIITVSKKMTFHTHLNQLFVPIYDEIDKYNWLISDIEYNGTYSFTELPINMTDDYFILSSQQFKALLIIDVQIWWGVILGIPKDRIVEIDEKNLPYSEFNEMIWKNGHLQHPYAEIEIVCWDSSLTIIKFTDKQTSDKFKMYFDEARELESYQ